MFFLSFTAQPERRGGRTRRSDRAKRGGRTRRSDRAKRGNRAQPQEVVVPPRHQTIVTAALLFLWFVLMVFGILTFLQPEWLQDLSQSGKSYSADTLSGFGDDCYRAGDFTMASHYYRKALDRQPHKVHAKLNLALSLDKMGHTRQAISILEETLQWEITPSERQSTCHNLGVLAGKRGDVEGAVGYFEQAAGLSVDARQSLMKLASLHIRAERFDKARVALQEALARWLDVTLPYKSMLERALEDYRDEGEQFVTAIEKLLSIDVGADQLTRFDLQTARRGEQGRPEIVEIHNRLSYVYSRLGKIDAAIEHMQKVLEIMPNNEGARNNLSILQKARSAPPGGAPEP